MLNNKVVLITGGTGSFGKKCVEIILKKYKPKKVIIFSRDELKQYEMAHQFTDDVVRFFIGDVRDKERLSRAFQGVDYVIHAAAMKHVPASEYNPTEAIKTNIIGAQNIVNVAADRRVKKVIALSTDKAVSPINLYGATKLCSDKLFIAGNSFVSQDPAIFSVVRYGNVIGSRGSVIPFFKEKRAEGIIPITHPGMTRFWITLEQGVDFVLTNLERMRGGEIFIPKIPSMSIMQLAEYMCPECKTKIIGIRQGEKLHELLISKDDARNTLEFENYYLVKPEDAHFKGRYDETGAKQVPEGFEYSSNSNKEWVTKEQIKAMIDS